MALLITSIIDCSWHFFDCALAPKHSIEQTLQLAAVDQGGNDAFVGDAEAGGQIGDMGGFVQGTSVAQIGGQGADESIAGARVVDCSGLVGWEVLVPAGSDQGAAMLAQGDDDLAHSTVDQLFRLVHHGSWSRYQGVQLVEIRDQDVDRSQQVFRQVVAG